MSEKFLYALPVAAIRKGVVAATTSTYTLSR